MAASRDDHRPPPPQVQEPGAPMDRLQGAGASWGAEPGTEATASGGGAGLTGRDPFAEELSRWVAEGTADAAVDERRRGRWLRQQLDEEATLTGTLLDLAERGAGVVVTARSGRRYPGMVRLLGVDVVVVSTDQRTTALVALDAVVAVRTGASERRVVGERDVQVDAGRHEALAVLVADRPRVTVVTVGGEVHHGDLRSVGIDVITIRLEGDGARLYVPIGAVDELVVDDREVPDLLG